MNLSADCKQNILLKRLEKTIENDNLIMESLVQWVTILSENKDLMEVFADHGYKTIAIYGYGHLGRLLEKTLKGSDVRVLCIMDRKFSERAGYFLSADADIPKVDAIIVTSAYYFTEIKAMLSEKAGGADIRLFDEFLFQL